jgi:D-inositol-3-phosphate glycosyltransferase
MRATQTRLKNPRLKEAVSASRGNCNRRITSRSVPEQIAIALLTGGGDKPYALGMASTLSAHGIAVDFIGSDELNIPEIRNLRLLRFFNLRGDQRTGAPLLSKVTRLLHYYLRLIRYAATARPKIFHLLWNNKFEYFDRTLLMLFYRLLGKRVVVTAHNVNAGKRDSNDSYFNRLTLRIQYRLAERIFVHTPRMKQEMISEFGIPEGKVVVIPFGINNTAPNTALTRDDAKRQFGITSAQKTLLFFGNIVPYKGLEHLLEAVAILVKKDPEYRIIVGGRIKDCADYWERIVRTIATANLSDHIVQKIEYIPDEQVEAYFKAADVLVLPYTHVFQSGVLFLGYSFGLPAIVSDVGSMREDVIEGQTGFVSKARDPENLSQVIEEYFGSTLFENLDVRRSDIQQFANERYSWDKVAEITKGTYGEVLEG